MTTATSYDQDATAHRRSLARCLGRRDVRGSQSGNRARSPTLPKRRATISTPRCARRAKRSMPANGRRWRLRGARRSFTRWRSSSRERANELALLRSARQRQDHRHRQRRDSARSSTALNFMPAPRPRTTAKRCRRRCRRILPIPCASRSASSARSFRGTFRCCSRRGKLRRRLPPVARSCSSPRRRRRSRRSSSARSRSKPAFPKACSTSSPARRAISGSGWSSIPASTRSRLPARPQPGKLVAATAARTLKRVTLELGGKSPSVVFDDADVDGAVAGALYGIYYNAGQSCEARSRVLVQAGVYDRFVASFVETREESARRRSGGSADARRRDHAAGAVREDQGRTARSARPKARSALFGGDAADARRSVRRRNVLEPDRVRSRSRRTASRAKRSSARSPRSFASKTKPRRSRSPTTSEYGLSASVWTQNVGRANRVARAIRAGTVAINTPYAVFPGRAVRRLQTIGLRARARHGDDAPLQRNQERAHLHRRETDGPVRSIATRSMAEALKIGEHYDTTYGTLWKDGTYFPRGTRVMVVGMHVEQGFCVRFPAEARRRAARDLGRLERSRRFSPRRARSSRRASRSRRPC